MNEFDDWEQKENNVSLNAPVVDLRKKSDTSGILNSPRKKSKKVVMNERDKWNIEYRKMLMVQHDMVLKEGKKSRKSKKKIEMDKEVRKFFDRLMVNVKTYHGKLTVNGIVKRIKERTDIKIVEKRKQFLDPDFIHADKKHKERIVYLLAGLERAVEEHDITRLTMNALGRWNVKKREGKKGRNRKITKSEIEKLKAYDELVKSLKNKGGKA